VTVREEIHLSLTINETNAILFALAKQPYDTVAQLIDKIRDQALPQVPEDQRNDNRDAMAKRLAEIAEDDETNYAGA